MPFLTKLFLGVNLIALLSAISIGLFVFLRKRSKKNFLYCLVNFNLAAWAGAMLMVAKAGKDIQAFSFCVRVSTAVAIFIPAVFYHFVVSLDEESLKKRKEIPFWYIISAFLAFLAFTPPFIQRCFFYEPTPGYPLASPVAIYGKTFILVTVYALGLLLYSTTYLWRRWKESFGLKRIELEYILLTSVVGTFFTGITALLSPYLKIVRFTPLAPFASVMMSGIIAYGIARYKILETSFVLQRTTAYALLTLSLTFTYALIVLLLNWLFRQFLPPYSPLPSMLAALIIAFAFAPLKQWIQTLVNKLFSRDRYQPEEVLSELSRTLSLQTNISDLLQTSLEKVGAALKVKSGVIILEDKRTGRFIISSSLGKGIQKSKVKELYPEHPLIQELRREGEILVREELERLPFQTKQQSIISFLKKLGGEIVIPLLIRKELVGIIIFNRKETGKIFSRYDLGFLRTIAGQLAVAIKNAELFSKLQRAERLVAVGTLAAGLAHEIRNPLVSIKTFIQLLPEKFNDPEFRNNFSQIASQEVDRINRILEELLNFARPTPVNKSIVDPYEIIERSLFLLTNELEEKKIALKKEYKTDEIRIEGDEGQLQHAFSNIFLNSIQVMEENGQLSITTELSSDNHSLLIRITDTGPGIPSEDLPRIFDPFFTTKSGGTGLGLSIAHAIIEEHNGKIEVQSTPGKGATFLLEFPILSR